MTTLRALLIDSQPTLRASVRSLLEADGFVVCGEAADADAGVETAIRERPDICLVAVVVPGGGITAVRRIRDAVPETAIIMLTRSAKVDDLFDAIRAGAVGYLLKDMDPDRLPFAVRGALAGEAAIPRSLVAALVGELQSRGRERAMVGLHGPVVLTAREWDVFDLLGSDLSTAEVAERLFVSPVTVRRHASAVVAKLGAENRDEALALLARARSGAPPVSEAD